MPEAMKLVRSELGNDAIILHSRVIQTGGFLGFFKKRRIEVVAALDNQVTQTINPTDKADIPTPFKESLKNQPVRGEQKVKDETSEVRPYIEPQRNLYHEKSVGIPLPPPIDKVRKLLIDQELEEDIVNEVVGLLIQTWYKRDGDLSYEEIKSLAKQSLIEKISHLPFGGITLTKKYINVVGPTGVGKTTTLAKIAAMCILSFKKKVAFITTDTYRIAAIEQLKTYANILNVPVEVCYNLEDFQHAKENFASYDLVFIDTAGRNFRNAQYVEDLKTIIDFNHEMETLLVLSLTSKQRDLNEIIGQFSSLDINRFVFTKADETSTYGAMYNVMKRESRGTAYVTNGQSVPDDLVTATPENVVDFIVGAD